MYSAPYGVYKRPCGSPVDNSEPGGAEPFSMDAAVVGTDMRGDRMSGAPSGAAGVRRGVARPGMAGLRSRVASAAAAAATLLHSSSQAGNEGIDVKDFFPPVIG